VIAGTAQQSLVVTVTMTSRRLRRFVPAPLFHQRHAIATAGLGAAAAIGTGVWLGFVAAALAVSASTATTVVIALGLLLGWSAGSVWPDVRVSLVERHSWAVYADRGVSPLTFMVGRHVLERSTRLVVAGAFGVSAIVVLDTHTAEDLTALTWAATLASGPAAASGGLLFALLRFRSTVSPHTPAILGSVLLGSLVVVAAGWATTAVQGFVRAWGAGPSVAMAVLPDERWTIALLVTGISTMAGVAIVAYQSRNTEWGDIIYRSELSSDRLARRARGTVRGRMSALILLDARRALRSFEWRIRPALFTTLAMMLSVIVLGAIGAWLFADEIRRFSAGPVGATVVAGMCAGYVFIVYSSLAPFLSLDSDRRGIAILRVLPFGMVMMTALRAASGAMAVGLVGTIFVGLLVALVPLDDRAIGTAALACMAVALAAPVLTSLASIRLPQTDWKEAAELGQRGWARALSTYAVGIAIAVSISIGSAQAWSPTSAALSVVALTTATPAIAAAAAALLPTSRGAA